jgi:vacuolar-type H+-ATPase subunit H
MSSPRAAKPCVSPLLEIQRAEVEVASLIEVAHAAAQKRVDAARKGASRVKREAVDAGRSEGETSCREIVATARQEAEQILAQARQEADALRRNREHYVELMFKHGLKIVIELQKEVDLV